MKHKLFKKILNEGKIRRFSLDSTVFQYFDNGRMPILHDGIKVQILEDVAKVQNMIRIKNFFLTGDLLTTSYTKSSDLKVIIQLDPNDLNFVSTNSILLLLKKISGKLAIGTTHPINYTLIVKEYDFGYILAAYDIINERWIKISKEFDSDLQSHLTDFSQALETLDVTNGEIRRNIIDLNKLLKLPTSKLRKIHIEFKRKLMELEDNIHHLITLYKNAKVLNQIALNRARTPTEIQMYSSKYKMPEVVKYELMKRYYYVKYIKNLEHILQQNNNSVSVSNLQPLNDISKKFLHEKNESWNKFSDDPLKDKNLNSKKYKNPLKSHKYKMARGLNRKNLRQVPVSHSPGLKKIAAVIKAFKRKRKNLSLMRGIKGLDLGNEIVDKAKKAEGGVWRISNAQVYQIAQKYKFHIPDIEKPTKHLGSTSIQMVRYPNNTTKEIEYYLYKPYKMYHTKKHKSINSQFSNLKNEFLGR